MTEPQIKARALVLTMQMQGLEFEVAVRCAYIAVEELIKLAKALDCEDGSDLKFWIEVREELMKL